jgi:zinc transporter ZupT
MTAYITLFAIGMLSGSLIFFKKGLKKYISALLSFSGAYLLSVSFLHLLPHLFEGDSHNLGVYLLVGFFLQLVLDYFSGGIEHGHTHVNHKQIGRFPLLVFLSLCLHAFLEAFPLSHLSDQQGWSYLSGLSLHKAPIAFILASLLMAYQLPKISIVIGILFFSLMAPFGAYFGSYVSEDTEVFKQLMAVSVGIILHLSTTILFENNEEHIIQWKKLFPMLAGALLALLTLIGH